MRAGPGFMNIMLPSLQVEFLYSLIAAILLFVIYFKTAEIYNLTKHKGIRYFRDAFLFFGIAHVFRFMSNFFMISEPPSAPGARTLVVIGYLVFSFASSMAMLSLAYSSVHKKINKGFFSKGYSRYILALAMFIPVIILNQGFVFIITQLAILVFAIIMSGINEGRRKRKKKTVFTQILYVLFLLSWIGSIMATSISPMFLGWKILFYAISLIIIAVLVIKVWRKT